MLIFISVVKMNKIMCFFNDFNKFILQGLLVQHGLRVTCELTVNFPSLLGKAYKSSAFLMSAKAASGEQARGFSVLYSFVTISALCFRTFISN